MTYGTLPTDSSSTARVKLSWRAAGSKALRACGVADGEAPEDFMRKTKARHKNDALHTIPRARISRLRARIEPRLEVRSIKRCQPIPPDMTARQRSWEERGLSLFFSHNYRQLSKSGWSAGRQRRELGELADRKTISLPISASRLRKHATRLSSASGLSRRKARCICRCSRPPGCWPQVKNAQVRVA
jgi:hypothetical protein